MEDFFYGFCPLGLNPQVELFIFNWNERLDFSHQETERVDSTPIGKGKNFMVFS